MNRIHILASFVFFFANLFYIKNFECQLEIKTIMFFNFFLFVLFWLSSFLQKKIKNQKSKIQYFWFLNLARIIICLIIIYPFLKTPIKTSNLYIYNFFLIYFFQLFLTLFIQKKLINK